MGNPTVVGAPVSRDRAGASRPPWWLAVVVLTFLAYSLLLTRTDLRRPEAPGFTLTIDGVGMTVVNVGPGTPADTAGIEPGDRVLAVAGRMIRSRLDWYAFAVNLLPSQSVAFDIVREGIPIRREVTFPPEPADFWLTTPGVTLAAARSMQLVTLLMALVVILRRPFDRAARIGSWLLATVAVYSVALPYGLAAAWRALPEPVGLSLWIPYTSSLLVPQIVLTFFAMFPRPLFHSPLAWIALWIPAMPGLFVQMRAAWWMVYTPDQAAPVEDWTNAVVATAVVYVVASFVAVIVGYRRETDLTARRRVRVLAFGSMVGMLSVLPIVIDYWRADAMLGPTVFVSPATAVGTLVGLLLPASFAYAILKQRLFDIDYIVRRSLQYALARRVLESLVPLAAAAFAIDLWINRQVSIGEILRARGWMYATLAGLAVIARLRRDVWLEGLDRRFFRERYNAQRVLRSISEEIRQAPKLSSSGPHIVARLEEALHPELAALLVRESGARAYTALAIAPVGTRLEPLAADSAIAGLLALLRQPIRAAPHDRDSLLRQLPPEDLEWLRRHRLELLVPSRFSADGPEAFFVLGAKRSEEPYSAQDEDMLMTIGHGVALLLPRSSSDGFDECPVCGLCYELGTGRCAEEDSPLARQTVSRVLGGRYRLMRRIGRGGMGTVYAADDLALERRVAVKLLREDIADPSGAERFRTEARIAAALAHPNIVTVYDIGVTVGGHAFFVMELLEGVTLDEALHREGRFAPDRVLHLLKEVGAAVKAAHARQLIHRDLKPANIFLCRGNAGEVPKILDFGLAKALEASRTPALTQFGIVAGTPRYMAPEHLRGQEASSDWDLWALAGITLEMLAGVNALDGPQGATPRLDCLSPPLRQLFAAALSPDPLDRPTDVDEFLGALERALAEHEHFA
jgi:eukaryotic-like serine/threonine-protein kinase